jgi:hypothetical protein
MASLPTGTVTFLFTDIEESTPRWAEDEGAMRRELADHHFEPRGQHHLKGVAGVWPVFGITGPQPKTQS